MATIDDIHAVERLMQTLDENPHLLAAVRSRVLTQELLELPETVARIAVRVEQTAEQLAQLTARVDQLYEAVAQLTARVDQLSETVAQLSEAVAQLTARVDQLSETVAQLANKLDQFAEETNRRLERLERGVNRIQGDIAQFRSTIAIGAALRNAAVIAGSLGLTRTRNLSQDELMALTRSQDTTGIPRNELDSFHLADLVMEATDDDGQPHYIAVEASFTADERDTRRAIRNASYMTRFTGRTARAVVVAMRADRRIDEQIASGAVHWYQMPERQLSRD